MARDVEKITTITISRDLHRKFKAACARSGVTQRSVIERLVWSWIKATERKENR